MAWHLVTSSGSGTVCVILWYEQFLLTLLVAALCFADVPRVELYGG